MTFQFYISFLNGTHNKAMHQSLQIFAAVAVATLIYIISSEHARHQAHRDLIDGFWDASQAFCLRSGVEGANALFRDGRVYLLITEGDRVILNKCVGVTLSPKWWSGEGSESCWRVTFSEDVDPLPQECELRLDPERAMLGLFDDDIVHLELFKNAKATAGVV